MSERLYSIDGNRLEEENFIEKGGQKIEQFEISTTKYEFNGLTREQLEHYGKDPKWRRIRWLIAIGFWIIFTGMLTSALLIIIFTQKCAPIQDLNWFESSIIYRVEVSQFKDTNGDLIGDFEGVTSNINYLKTIGVDTLLLEDVLSDNFSLDDELGSQDEFNELVRQLKQNDLHLMVTVPFVNVTDLKDGLKNWLKSGIDGAVITIKNESEIETLRDQLSDLNNLFVESTKSSFKPKILLFENIPTEHHQLFVSLSNTLVAKRHNLQLNDITKTINSTYTFFNNQWPIISLDNQKNFDISSHFGILMLLTLRGTPLVEQGDEIGLTKRFPFHMNWDNSNTCGFTANKTFQINSNCTLNAQWQLAHGSGDSQIKLFKELAKLRDEPSFQWGDQKFFLEDKSTKVFSYLREAYRFDGYLIAFNPSNEIEFNDFHTSHDVPLEAQVVLHYSTLNIRNNDFIVGNELTTDKILLRPGDILVLKYSRFETKEKEESSSNKLH